MQRQELFQPGDVIDGRYSIESVIGEGGFATVYRARHLVMGRLAAVKVLRLTGEGDAARSFEARFIQEAQAASRVQHPSLAAIYDVGFQANARLRSATLRFDDGTTQRLAFDEHDRTPARFKIPARSTRRVRLEIDAAWPGARWDDLAVSEVTWWGAPSPP